MPIPQILLNPAISREKCFPESLSSVTLFRTDAEKLHQPIGSASDLTMAERSYLSPFQKEIDHVVSSGTRAQCVL
jgi:hypothetical protein